MSYLGLDADDMENMVKNWIFDYRSIKEFIKDYDKDMFDKWAAGGFIVDDSIVSMYPNMQVAFC